jgi:surface antigen
MVVGLATSYLVTDYRLEQRMAQLASGREADQILRNSTLSAALEQQISGQTVTWTNPDTGTSGRITPVRTFKSKTGQWCREFDSELTRVDQSELRRGIACREPEGIWKIRLVLYEES